MLCNATVEVEFYYENNVQVTTVETDNIVQNLYMKTLDIFRKKARF